VKVAAALALLVASLALVAAGCGGEDEASADPTAEWAEGFCTAITTWTDAITEATDELRSLSSLNRDSFEQAGEDIRTATQAFGDDLRALGSPETESGEEAQQAIDDFATTLDEDSADIEAAIENISEAKDVPEFVKLAPKAVQDITASLSSMNAAFSTMLSTIRKEDPRHELQKAFEDAEACGDIGAEETTSGEVAESTFGDGEHRVGADITAGTYRAPHAESGCYWARLRDFSGELDAILANSNESGPTVVTIKSTDAGFESNGCGSWTSDLSQVTDSRTSFGDGTYIVGVDIAPGRFASQAGSGCYWARLRSFTGDFDAIIANDNPSGRAVVEISRADRGFQSKGCGIWSAG
jgi:hypothetical protein